MTDTDAQDRDNERAVRKMVLNLIKHGAWERHMEKAGRLKSLKCGAVEILRWEAHDHVNVFVGGFKLCTSVSGGRWEAVARKAKSLFFREAKASFHEYLALEFSKARAALLKAQEPKP